MARWVLGWVIGVTGAACGGSEDPPANPNDAGVDQAGGASGSGGGGASGTAGHGAMGGSAGSGGVGASGGTSGAAGTEAAVGSGFIGASQGAMNHGLSAYFERWPAETPCAVTERGACRIEACDRGAGYASAGEVAVSVGATRRVAPPLSNGEYYGTWNGLLWQPGDAVRLTASGAEGPAIDETLTAPAAFSLIEPAGDAIVVSRAQDLRVRWSGGGNARAVVGLVSGGGMAHYVHVKCAFDAALGEGTIPAAALADLDPAVDTRLQSFAEDYRTSNVDGWAIRLSARTDPVSLAVTLQ